MFAQYGVVGHGAGNEGPKFGGVVKVRQVAQLVHDDVVGHCGREINEFVIKIEIAQLRAAAPARLVVFYKNFADGELIIRVKMLHSHMYQCTRDFALLEIIAPISAH